MEVEIQSKKDIFRDAIRSQIFNRSNAMHRNLMMNTKFLISKTYPTQVLNTSLGRYIRINEEDLTPETADDLLSMMLNINYFAHIEGEELDPEYAKSTIIQAIDNSDNTDYTDIRNNKTLVSLDEFGSIQGVNSGLQPQVIRKPIEVAGDTDVDKTDLTIPADADMSDIEGDESIDDMTGTAEDLAEAMGMTTPSGSKKDTSVTKAEMELDKELEQSLADTATHKGKSTFHRIESILTLEDLRKLEPKVKQLLKAFEGSGGKVKKMTPSKKISSKDVGLDKDRVYIKKTPIEGKHIKLNILIDMSGSMSGSPVKNAVRLVWLFNQLAKAGYVTMHVFYSESNTHYQLTLPATDSEVLSLCRTGAAEGLAKTVHANANTLKHVNCICITDGDITDDPIDKQFWTKHRIISTGVYVNSKVKSADDYKHSMDKWFNNTIIRQNIDDLIEWLIRVGLKG